jgi:hypothetical protein
MVTLAILSGRNNMFREYRSHSFGLSLWVDHSAGLNRLPCLIEGGDQSMDLIRVKRP